MCTRYISPETADIERYATQLSLDMTRFRADSASPEIEAQIQASRREGERLDRRFDVVGRQADLRGEVRHVHRDAPARFEHPDALAKHRAQHVEVRVVRVGNVAAADVFVALGSERPQRPRLEREAIEREMLAMAARSMGVRAKGALRVNPGVKAGGHAYIETATQARRGMPGV